MQQPTINCQQQCAEALAAVKHLLNAYQYEQAYDLIHRYGEWG